MRTNTERICFACGFPAEAPFITVMTRSGVAANHKGAEAVLCTECVEKIEAKLMKRPDAPV